MTNQDRIRQMIDAGMTVREIANALGLSTQGVHYHLKRMDLKPKQRRR